MHALFRNKSRGYEERRRTYCQRCKRVCYNEEQDVRQIEVEVVD